MKRILTALLWAVLIALPSCSRKATITKTPPSGQCVREFHWSYGGHGFRAALRFDPAAYRHYDSVPKDMAYECYAREDSAYPYLRCVLLELRGAAAPYRFDRMQWAGYLLAFVQSIPYGKDPEGPEFSRYPLLSLADLRCDCEDKALLFAALCSGSGINAALFELPGEAHVAAGVEAEGADYDTYRGISGRRYAFAECTSKGWLVGENPHPGSAPHVIELEPARDVPFLGIESHSYRYPRQKASAASIDNRKSSDNENL